MYADERRLCETRLWTRNQDSDVGEFHWRPKTTSPQPQGRRSAETALFCCTVKMQQQFTCNYFR